MFIFKRKTAYEMRISDWSSDVCSSDLRCGERAAGPWHPTAHNGRTGGRHLCLGERGVAQRLLPERYEFGKTEVETIEDMHRGGRFGIGFGITRFAEPMLEGLGFGIVELAAIEPHRPGGRPFLRRRCAARYELRSEEHTSELQSLMRIS